MLILTETDLII